MKPQVAKIESPLDDRPKTVPTNTDSALPSQSNTSSVYFVRIPIWISLFILEHAIEDFLGIHLWKGVAILASLALTYCLEKLKNKAFGSAPELQIGGWLRNQIPLIVAGGLIYLFVWRYLNDLQQP